MTQNYHYLIKLSTKKLNKIKKKTAISKGLKINFKIDLELNKIGG